MSLFSYIAFPRPVDKSCLESKVDKSKVFTVGELRGTDFEKMIKGGISSMLPDNLNVYTGDMADFWGMNIFDKYDEVFNGVFKNEYIYRLEASFDFRDPEEMMRQSMDIYRESSEEENGGQTEAEFMAFSQKLTDDINGRAALCRKQLIDIVNLNAKPGEIVETYSIWLGNENPGNYGPPEKVISIEVGEILTSTMLDLRENEKLEISPAIK